MKKLERGALLAAAIPMSAHAANWQQIQGNEPPDSGHFKVFGFLQPTYTSIDADPIEGLLGAAAAFNGQLTVPNRVGPDLEGGSELQFNRARLGLRGNIVPGKINYFLLAEAGRNSITSERDLMLVDASITFNYIPGARIRAGLFKLPTSEEALVGVHTSYPYVNFSNVASNLLIEVQVEAAGAVSAVGASNGAVVSGGSGFRDWGVQVYDWGNRGPWEFSYALMASNGNEIGEFNDDDDSKDVSGRLQASYVFGKSKRDHFADAGSAHDQ